MYDIPGWTSLFPEPRAQSRETESWVSSSDSPARRPQEQRDGHQPGYLSFSELHIIVIISFLTEKQTQIISVLSLGEVTLYFLSAWSNW